MASPPAYLNEYLNKIAEDEGFIQHTLHYESGSNHGDGFIAVMIAVTIKGKQALNVDDEKELSLMCKILPENKARRDVFKSHMLFEREVCVYSRMLPMFEQFQRDRNISESEGFFQYPKCYLAVANAVNDHYVIIMENLKVAKYELWDKMKPVDFDTSSIFLQALGRYHGISLALRDQKPELFNEILELEDILTVMVETPIICNMMEGAIDKAVEHLICEDEKNFLRKIKENYKLTIKERLFAPNAAGQLSVLIHGDCWNNNFCFKTDANIESLDDHSGRLLIKLALGSTKDWFNEFMVQAVSKAEYAQYGKVLNYAKYEEYKKKQEDKERLEHQDHIKIEKIESSESTSKAYQRSRQRSDSSPTAEEANDRRISSSKNRYTDKHSSHRDRSYSTSDDDRRNTDRTSKYNSSRRDPSPETSHRTSKPSSHRKSSDDSDDDSDRRAKYSSSSRSSHKKTKSKKHFKSRSYSKDHRQRYHSSDDEDKHYNKKTKKSKRARSRSRDRR